MKKATACLISIFLAVLMVGCEGKVPESADAKKIGSAPKQTVDKVVNEANKAVEQGEARTRDAIDGNK
jgi:outer membrane PBP1 activator LpoA protein